MFIVQSTALASSTSTVRQRALLYLIATCSGLNFLHSKMELSILSAEGGHSQCLKATVYKRARDQVRFRVHFRWTSPQGICIEVRNHQYQLKDTALVKYRAARPGANPVLEQAKQCLGYILSLTSSSSNAAVRRISLRPASI